MFPTCTSLFIIWAIQKWVGMEADKSQKKFLVAATVQTEPMG